MIELVKKVEEFQHITKQLNNTEPKSINWELAQFIYNIALEELNEYREACEKGDLVGIFDALLDQLYILIGTFNTHGMQSILIKGFEEVHRSNMSKLDDNNQPLYNEIGKVMKSKNYTPPKLDDILEW